MKKMPDWLSAGPMEFPEPPPALFTEFDPENSPVTDNLVDGVRGIVAEDGS